MRKEKEWKRIDIPVKGYAGYNPAIITDPYGSYTGRPRDPEDKPVQDADDL